MHIYEADIKSYFDRVNHDWLKRMLAERVVDRTILRLIHRWLRAGVMDGGVVISTRQGVPQGGPISPLLANVYLHYALDLWFEKVVKPRCKGNVELVRYADDFVACFQYERDAMRFARALRGRIAKFGLELAPEKTRRILFGRFARERLLRKGHKPSRIRILGLSTYLRRRQGRQIRGDPTAIAEGIAPIQRPGSRLAMEAYALESKGPAATTLVDAPRVLHILRLTSLLPEIGSSPV